MADSVEQEPESVGSEKRERDEELPLITDTSPAASPTKKKRMDKRSERRRSRNRQKHRTSPLAEPSDSVEQAGEPMQEVVATPTPSSDSAPRYVNYTPQGLREFAQAKVENVGDWLGHGAKSIPFTVYPFRLELNPAIMQKQWTIGDICSDFFLTYGPGAESASAVFAEAQVAELMFLTEGAREKAANYSGIWGKPVLEQAPVPISDPQLLDRRAKGYVAIVSGFCNAETPESMSLAIRTAYPKLEVLQVAFVGRKSAAIVTLGSREGLLVLTAAPRILLHNFLVSIRARDPWKCVKVFVSGLPPGATEHSLTHFMKDKMKTPPRSVVVLKDRYGLAKGFAFVTFDNMSQAKAALLHSGQYCAGRETIIFSLAKARKTRSTRQPNRVMGMSHKRTSELMLSADSRLPQSPNTIAEVPKKPLRPVPKLPEKL